MKASERDWKGPRRRHMWYLPTAILRIVLVAFVTLSMAWPAVGESTQQGPKGPPKWSVETEVDVGHTLATDLDEGDGSFALYEAGAEISARRVLRDLDGILNFGFQVDLLDFDLEEGNSLLVEKSGRFDHVLETEAGVNLVLRRGEWSYMGFAGVGMSGEEGVSVDDAAFVLGGLGLVGQWSDRVRFGFGLVARTRLEDDALVVPFITVDFWMTDDLKLGIRNGLAAEYRLDPDRTYLTLNANYDSHRFRLDGDEPLPDGVVEYQRIPVSLGIRHNFSHNLAVRSSVGAIVWHRFELADRNGKDLGDTDADPTAVLRVAVRFGF